MARAKKLDMTKVKSTLQKHTDDHSDWKERVKSAVDSGEHKIADTAIKAMKKTRDSLHKVIEHVEAHAEKKRPKSDS